MTLTPEQIEWRKGRITASMAPIICYGSDDKVLALWEELTGRRERDDLSHVWPVQMGNATEALNLGWVEWKRGEEITARQMQYEHPAEPWIGCTVDGICFPIIDDKILGTVVEAKYTDGDPMERAGWYWPQLVVQMACTECLAAILSIIARGREPVILDYERDHAAEAEIIEALRTFHGHVVTDTAPVDLPQVRAAPAAVRTVDMTAGNRAEEWRQHATDWLENKGAAAKFEAAKTGLKDCMPDDAALAYGAGVQAKRAKNRAVTIKEMDDE